MGTLVILDGEILDPGSARISVFDHGFLFGDSVYEVVRTRGGEPFLLDEHLARLQRSASILYMDLPFAEGELRRRVVEAILAAGNEESYVRLVVTRGVGELELHPGTCERPTVLLIVKPLVLPDASFYEEGIRLAVVGRRRISPHSSPTAKTGNYLNNVLAIIEARSRNADDAVMLNAEDHLTESTTANVFFVRDGTVHTPALDSGILEGITRGLVIRMLGEENLPYEVGLYGPDDLRSADEAFLTSTTRDVMPVREVDGAPLPTAPGPVTKRLAARFAAL